MRVVIQRVRYARLSVAGELISQISQGLMVLVGIAEEDGREEINYLCKKFAALRIFDDDEGVMNRSVVDVGGEVIEYLYKVVYLRSLSQDLEHVVSGYKTQLGVQGAE